MRIQKRPILHPAIPSPYAGANQPKVIYVSTNTPFISAVKRVRKLLSLIDKRSMGKVDLINGKGKDKQKLRAIAKQEKKPEEVLLKATSRAIEKVLGLALFFQGQEDCRVRLRTGSVGVVDDIVEVERPGAEGKIDEDPEDGMDRDGKEGGVPLDQEEEEEEQELPETQIRMTSMVEVGISLR